jgi:transmembrane sensor
MSNDDIQEFVIDCITNPDNRDKQTALKEWLQASEENRVLFAEITRIWEIAETIPATPFSTTEGWAALSPHITTNANVSTRKIWWWAAAAAAVLIPLFIILTGEKEQHFIASSTNKDSLLLPDGSMVYTKPGTAFTYTNARTVKLEKGEAFFKVVHNPKQQFIVKLDNAAVTVLGTSFNIKIDASVTDVAVWEGKVSMAAADSSIILKEGETGHLQHNKLSKITSYLVFEDEEAGAVAAVLSSYYHVKITVPDSLLKKRITVRFRNASFEQVQEVLAEVLDK